MSVSDAVLDPLGYLLPVEEAVARLKKKSGHVRKKLAGVHAVVMLFHVMPQVPRKAA